MNCFVLVLSIATVALGHDVNSRTHDAHIHGEGGHDATYDHEAFLGKEAAEFDQLSPEQSKKRLRAFLPQIDTNNDTKITKEELIAHVNKMARQYVKDNVDLTWKIHAAHAKDGKLGWPEYRKSVSGVEDVNQPITDETYKEMLMKDERRWKIADKDGDGKMNIEEFECLIHPEECPEMRDLMITEGVETYDKDKDGFVSWDEYIGDIWTEEDQAEVKAGIEPEWMTAEKEMFKQHKDTNDDGKLDRKEVGNWLFPEGYDHASIEARHLIDMADDDKDGKLTFDEVINNHEIFAGSQATAYGEGLKKVHDPAEL